MRSSSFVLLVVAVESELETVTLGGTLTFSNGTEEQQQNSLECLQGYELAREISQEGDEIVLELDIRNDFGDVSSVRSLYTNLSGTYPLLLAPFGYDLSVSAASAVELRTDLESANNALILHSAPTSVLLNSSAVLLSTDLRHLWIEHALELLYARGAATITTASTDGESSEDFGAKCQGLLTFARSIGFSSESRHLSFNSVRAGIEVVRSIAQIGPDVVLFCGSLDDTRDVLQAKLFLSYEPKALILDQTSNLDTLGDMVVDIIVDAELTPITDCWGFDNLSNLRSQFLSKFGKEPSDTAVRCATAAQTILTALDESNAKSQDVAVSDLRSYIPTADVKTCYGTLRDGSLMEEGLVGQFNVIVDSGTEFMETKIIDDADDLMYPARTEDEISHDTFPCAVHFEIEEDQCVACEPGYHRPASETNCNPCRVGYYSYDGDGCTLCSVMQVCTEAAATVPLASPGHFGAQWGTHLAYWECADPQVCAGATCVGVNEGFMCTRCPPGFARRGLWSLVFEQDVAGECYECRSKMYGFLWLGFLVFYFSCICVVAHLGHDHAKMQSTIVRTLVDGLQVISILSMATLILPEHSILSGVVQLFSNPFLAFVLYEDSCFLSDLGLERHQACRLLGYALLPTVVCLIIVMCTLKAILCALLCGTKTRSRADSDDAQDHGSKLESPVELPYCWSESHLGPMVVSDSDTESDYGFSIHHMIKKVSAVKHLRMCVLSALRIELMPTDGSRVLSVCIIFLYGPTMQLVCCPFSCESFDVRRQATELDVKCSNEPADVMAMFFIGAAYPCYVTLMWVWRRELNTQKVKRKWGFYYGGYKPQFCFWESVVMLRKWVFVVCALTENVVLRCVSLTFAITLFYLLNLRYHPSDNRERRLLETLDRSLLTGAFCLPSFRLLDAASSEMYMRYVFQWLFSILAGIFLLRFLVLCFWSLAGSCLQHTASSQKWRSVFMGRPFVIKQDGTLELRGLSISDRALISDMLRDLGEVYVAHGGVQHYKKFSTLVYATALVNAYHKLVIRKSITSRTSAEHEVGDGVAHAALGGVTVEELQLELLNVHDRIRDGEMLSYESSSCTPVDVGLPMSGIFEGDHLEKYEEEQEEDTVEEFQTDDGVLFGAKPADISVVPWCVEDVADMNRKRHKLMDEIFILKRQTEELESSMRVRDIKFSEVTGDHSPFLHGELSRSLASTPIEEHQAEDVVEDLQEGAPSEPIEAEDAVEDLEEGAPSEPVEAMIKVEQAEEVKNCPKRSPRPPRPKSLATHTQQTPQDQAILNFFGRPF